MKEPQELELEDIVDQVEHTGKLTPLDYAKLRKKTPQLVYYYMRTGVIEEERCACGRKVVDVVGADKALQEKESKRGGGVDSRNDEQRQG